MKLELSPTFKSILISFHEPPLYTATFSQAFETNSTSSGKFTRHGDVSGLVSGADDMFVVDRQADSVQLKFTDERPVPKGMVRDYFVVASAWFKGEGLPYVPFTVDALPFHNMTSYPYPSSEAILLMKLIQGTSQNTIPGRLVHKMLINPANCQII